ncbi:hypothetical protein LTR17_011668 [Elasticomyces elasticus]|nr:hypothetical protein LTR17_011668 [Elasticomyces elasticus]
MHDADLGLVAEHRQPSVVAYRDEKDVFTGPPDDSTEALLEPTQEELRTLRRHAEFAERFSYYGTTALFVNFLQQPRPFNSRTGAIVETQACYDVLGQEACVQPGGLGQGQQASTGLTTFNQASHGRHNVTAVPY